MPNLIWRFREFISSASPQRTLSILGALLLLAAIPLTTYVAQQQQDVRQRASESCQCTNGTWGPDPGICGSQYGLTCIPSACECQADGTYGPDFESCNTQFGLRCTPPPINTPTPTSTSCRCINNVYGPDYGACGSLFGQQCSSVESCRCINGFYGPDYANCGSQYGLSCTGNGAPPSPTSISGAQPTAPAAPTATGLPRPTQPPVASGGGGSCRDNPVAPDTNYKWVANCSKSCTQKSDCPQSTDTAFVDPETSNWCYGFGSVPADARCLQLQYIGSRIGATAIPTVPPGQASNCDPSLLTMSLSPTNPAVGASVTFNSSGTQGSTFIGDTWSGGVDCTGNFWGNKSCSATANGTFTWTHTWKNCAPNNCSITSAACTKSLMFTIGTAGATITVGPTAPAAPGDVIFNFTINLDAITTGRSLSTPQRNLAVELFNANGDKVVEKTSTNALAYNAANGKFIGAVNMGQITNGNYTVKAKSDRYLRKRIPGIVSVPASTQQITIPETTLIVGDMNNDNIVDIADYNVLLSCFGDKSASVSCGANKRNADLDDNNWVDEVDFNIYVRSLTIQIGD